MIFCRCRNNWWTSHKPLSYFANPQRITSFRPYVNPSSSCILLISVTASTASFKYKCLPGFKSIPCLNAFSVLEMMLCNIWTLCFSHGFEDANLICWITKESAGCRRCVAFGGRNLISVFFFQAQCRSHLWLNDYCRYPWIECDVDGLAVKKVHDCHLFTKSSCDVRFIPLVRWDSRLQAHRQEHPL